jgi:hypothetical protein
MNTPSADVGGRRCVKAHRWKLRSPVCQYRGPTPHPRRRGPPRSHLRRHPFVRASVVVDEDSVIGTSRRLSDTQDGCMLDKTKAGKMIH